MKNALKNKEEKICFDYWLVITFTLRNAFLQKLYRICVEKFKLSFFNSKYRVNLLFIQCEERLSSILLLSHKLEFMHKYLVTIQELLVFIITYIMIH